MDLLYTEPSGAKETDWIRDYDNYKEGV